MEKEKSNGIVIVLLTIIIILLVAIIGYFVYDKASNKTVDKNDNVEVIDNNETNNEEEVELTDVYIKNDVSSKTSLILTQGINDDKLDISYAYQVYIKNLNITNEDKFRIALNSALDAERLLTQSDAEKLKNTIYAIYGKDVELDSFVGIPLSQVLNATIIESKYRELFDEKITHGDFRNNCPIGFYDSSANMYLLSNECGGGAYALTLFYKNKYTQKGDNVYVYVSIATYDAWSGDIEAIYKGIGTDSSNLLYEKTLTYNNETQKYDIESEVKENYKKYEQYKLTYEKNSSGIYSFKNIEKIDLQ